MEKRAPEALGALPTKIWQQPWVVDTQAVGSGENALAYLARYVFKTATANRQLQWLPSGQVLWPYRDSNTGQRQSVALEPTELIRRFLQHDFAAQAPNLPDPQPNPSCHCPRCGRAMILLGSWRWAQKPPTPTRERAP